VTSDPEGRRGEKKGGIATKKEGRRKSGKTQL